jgi:hypothetical protein
VSAGRDHPAVTAARDQAAAAADDIKRRVRLGYQFAQAAEAAATGELREVGEGSGPPSGPRARVLEGVQRRLEGGELLACEHAAAEVAPGLGRRGGERPEALMWVSWHPAVIACVRCAYDMPRPSAAEDYTCDGCAHVGEPGDRLESVTYVIRASAEHAASTGQLTPPLICVFGLCPSCAAASDHGRPIRPRGGRPPR